nr:glutamyl-tRNA reductase-binding protein, chloroplastic [Tanacetum cinerariifolium]
MMMIMNTTVIHNHHQSLLCFNNKNKKKNKFGCCCVSASPSQSSTTTLVVSLDKNQNKPSAGEVEVDLCCVGVRFAVDPENGSPIVSLNPNIHHHSNNNITSTLNVQLEQCGGLRTTQCTIHGSLHTPTTPNHLN